MFKNVSIFSLFNFFKAAMSNTRSLKRYLVAAIAVTVAFALPDIASAANQYGDDGSNALSGIFNSIAGWTQGYLGRLVTLLFIAIGIISGMVRGSLMGFAVGIGAGIGLYNTPKVVETMFGAVLN
ncbi:MAG: conjugal transfer protein TraA [Rhizobium sp.]|nr:MAG: conjugal transfer protein TraA [Rhizobium sp.]